MEEMFIRHIKTYLQTLNPTRLELTEISRVNITPLPKGVWNFNYRVEVNDQVLVFKIYPPNQVKEGLLLENSGQHEYRALVLLSSWGVAPQPVLFDETIGIDGRPVLIYRYIPGEMLVFSDWSMTEAAKTFARLHSVPITPATDLRRRDETAAGLMADISNRLVSFAARSYASPVQIARFTRYVEQTCLNLTNVPLLPCPQTMLHTDPVPGNVVMASRVMLIDWQTPMIGDPAYDVWAFTADAFTLWDAPVAPTAAQKETFLKTYLHYRPDPGLMERLTQKESAFLLQYGLHCAIRYADYQANKIPPQLVKGREKNYNKYGSTAQVILNRLEQIL